MAARPLLDIRVPGLQPARTRLVPVTPEQLLDPPPPLTCIATCVATCVPAPLQLRTAIPVPVEEAIGRWNVKVREPLAATVPADPASLINVVPAGPMKLVTLHAALGVAVRRRLARAPGATL